MLQLRFEFTALKNNPCNNSLFTYSFQFTLFCVYGLIEDRVIAQTMYVPTFKVGCTGGEFHLATSA